MDYKLKRPCANCPFRTDCPEGWLGEERAEEIGLYGAEFACHSTVDYDDDSWEDGEFVGTGEDQQHCAGMLIMLEKMEQPHQMMRISERLGYYDPSKLYMDTPVFDDVEDFIYHHSNG